ncbi:MAG: metal-dependent hydrolase [Actinocatenispora sp.]
MMGPTHAVSGAAIWLAGCWAAGHWLNYHPGHVELGVGAAVCAGAALLPDLDLSGRVTENKGGATVAHTFGVVSLFMAEVVEKFSLGVYKITRAKRDPKRHNGHRTLTHTWLFNVALGFGVGALCARFGKWAVIAVLFLMFGLAIRGLLSEWAKKRGWLLTTLLSAAAALAAYSLLPADRGYPVIGAAIAAGGIVHTLGDMITKAGCPILWPIPTGRRLWREIGVPDVMAVRVGGGVERRFLLPAFVVIAAVAAVAVGAPNLFPSMVHNALG